jgi:hypothetical protein
MTSLSSSLQAKLIEAYRNTDFRVLGAQNFTLRVDTVSEPLRRLFEAVGVRSAAFVTAWNPYSATTALDDNRRAQTALRQRLANEGYSTIDGFGVDPTSDWAGEDSVLILGMPLDRAKCLGSELRQNAIVWVGDDAVPSLILLR